MGYTNTFIRVAEDSTATTGQPPKPRGTTKSVPILQFELLSDAPYQYTQDEIIFAVHLARNGQTEASEAEREAIWAELFSKEHACFRTSSLTKRYGWGVHYDANGKMAIYSVDSPEYQGFAAESESLKQLTAFRSRRR